MQNVLMRHKGFQNNLPKRNMDNRITVIADDWVEEVCKLLISRVGQNFGE
jgi:hypothetical protein